MSGERVFLQPYTDIGVLRREMEEMDDSEQRRFVRGLLMETHVSLHNHIADDARTQQKVEEMHRALFDPMNGLVNMRKWLCRIATWAGVGLGASITAIAGVASAGHSFGWW